jgi:hypothetical protein
MTNPDNIVRVRARNGGRASVYEANAWAQAFETGFLDTTGIVTENTSVDMNVLVGGATANPAIVIAANPAGYKIALDIVGQTAVTLTPPSANSRISAIVAYTDDLSIASTETSVTGSPATCGLIVVNGEASASPAAPDEATIRSAITADGATGSQASYAVLALVTVASDATTIIDSLIVNQYATFANGMKYAKADNIDWATIVYPDFYYSGAFSGTAGFSQTRTIPLPRAVKANERCVIMNNSKWCIINASPVDSGATTVNVDICPPITSENGLEFRLTAMYYTL